MTEQKTPNPGGFTDEQLLQLGRLLAPALARVEAREATHGIAFHYPVSKLRGKAFQAIACLVSHRANHRVGEQA